MSYLTSKNVAEKYSHKLANAPESRAGANERVGFIDASDIKPKKKISTNSYSTKAIQSSCINNDTMIWGRILLNELCLAAVTAS
jgi:hypothetical protein